MRSATCRCSRASSSCPAASSSSASSKSARACSRSSSGLCAMAERSIAEPSVMTTAKARPFSEIVVMVRFIFISSVVKQIFESRASAQTSSSYTHHSSLITHHLSCILRRFLIVELERSFVAWLYFAEPITAPGNLLIEKFPQRQAAGNVEQRRHPPKPPEPQREASQGGRAAVSPAVTLDDEHPLHQHLVRKVGIALGHDGCVKRQIGEMSLTIPPREPMHLGRTDPAIAVVDHHVGLRPLVGRRQMIGGGRRGRLAHGLQALRDEGGIETWMFRTLRARRGGHQSQAPDFATILMCQALLRREKLDMGHSTPDWHQGTVRS